jgi:hypothetical protein
LELIGKRREGTKPVLERWSLHSSPSQTLNPQVAEIPPFFLTSGAAKTDSEATCTPKTEMMVGTK